MTEAPTTVAGQRDIPTRRISFEYPGETLPRYFAAEGDIVTSHVVAVLSSLFPDGEEFFVRSVRHFRDQIEDPDLRRRVSGFIGQEAVHGREHREVNERLADLGYPTKAIERFVDRSLRLRERIAPARSNLAATSALEHYTATLAELLLSDPEARQTIAHEEVRALFLWHALEEYEHKSVAFDVYRAVGGSERMRTVTMNLIHVGFLSTLTVGTIVSILRDPLARRSPRRLFRSLARLRRSPFLSRRVVQRLRDYNRPGFHPDERDSASLVEWWRDELFGESGSLNDHLERSR
jgi:uncharacterized protein